jgi:hypothetical protein
MDAFGAQLESSHRSVVPSTEATHDLQWPHSGELIAVTSFIDPQHSLSSVTVALWGALVRECEPWLEAQCGAPV